MPTLRPEYATGALAEVSRSIYKLGGVASRPTLVLGDLQSNNYVSGSTGWSINGDTGDVEFNAGTFRGTLTIGDDDQPQVEIVSNVGTGEIVFPTNNVEEHTAAELAASHATDKPTITWLAGSYSSTLSASGDVPSISMTGAPDDDDATIPIINMKAPWIQQNFRSGIIWQDYGGAADVGGLTTSGIYVEEGNSLFLAGSGTSSNVELLADTTTTPDQLEVHFNNVEKFRLDGDGALHVAADQIYMDGMAGLFTLDAAFVDFTPTITQDATDSTALTFSTNRSRWRRVGAKVEVFIFVVFSSAGTASQAVKLELPANLTTNVNLVAGSLIFDDSSAGVYTLGVDGADLTNDLVRFIATGSGTGRLGTGVPITVASGDELKGFIEFYSVSA